MHWHQFSMNRCVFSMDLPVSVSLEHTSMTTAVQFLTLSSSELCPPPWHLRSYLTKLLLCAIEAQVLRSYY